LNVGVCKGNVYFLLYILRKKNEKVCSKSVFVSSFDGGGGGCGTRMGGGGNGLIGVVVSVRQKPHGERVHEQSHSIRGKGPHKGGIKATKENHRPLFLVALLCTVNDPCVLEFSLLCHWIRKKERKENKEQRTKNKEKKERKRKKNQSN